MMKIGNWKTSQTERKMKKKPYTTEKGKFAYSSRDLRLKSMNQFREPSAPVKKNGNLPTIFTQPNFTTSDAITKKTRLKIQSKNMKNNQILNKKIKRDIGAISKKSRKNLKNNKKILIKDQKPSLKKISMKSVNILEKGEHRAILNKFIEKNNIKGIRHTERAISPSFIPLEITQHYENIKEFNSIQKKKEVLNSFMKTVSGFDRKYYDELYDKLEKRNKRAKIVENMKKKRSFDNFLEKKIERQPTETFSPRTFDTHSKRFGLGKNMERLTNEKILRMFRKVSESKIEKIFKAESGDSALYAISKGDIESMKSIQNDNFEILMTAAFNLFTSVKEGKWDDKNYSRMSAVKSQFRDKKDDSGKQRFSSVVGERKKILNISELELLLYIVMKKIQNWGQLYNKCLDIIFKKEKERKMRQNLKPDTTEEKFEEIKNSGKLTVKNIAKSARSVTYFIDCLNKIVDYLQNVDKFLEGKEMDTELTKETYKDYIASKSLLKVRNDGGMMYSTIKKLENLFENQKNKIERIKEKNLNLEMQNKELEELLRKTKKKIREDHLSVKEASALVKKKLGPNRTEITKEVEQSYLEVVKNLENEVKKLREEKEKMDNRMFYLETNLRKYDGEKDRKKRLAKKNAKCNQTTFEIGIIKPIKNVKKYYFIFFFRILVHY